MSSNYNKFVKSVDLIFLKVGNKSRLDSSWSTMLTKSNKNRINLIGSVQIINNSSKYIMMFSLSLKPTIVFLFLCLLTTLVVSFHVRPVLHASIKSTLLMSELNSGGFENVYINRIDNCDDNTFGKFKVDTCIKRRDMNSILKAYREELIKKKVIYRGFRPGKVPPYAMPEIRSSVVNHAIATTIGELCFLNGLTVSFILYILI